MRRGSETRKWEKMGKKLGQKFREEIEKIKKEVEIGKWENKAVKKRKDSEKKARK